MKQDKKRAHNAVTYLLHPEVGGDDDRSQGRHDFGGDEGDGEAEALVLQHALVDPQDGQEDQRLRDLCLQEDGQDVVQDVRLLQVVDDALDAEQGIALDWDTGVALKDLPRLGEDGLPDRQVVQQVDHVGNCMESCILDLRHG